MASDDLKQEDELTQENAQSDETEVISLTMKVQMFKDSASVAVSPETVVSQIQDSIMDVRCFGAFQLDANT
jgi:hypothetical protein